MHRKIVLIALLAFGTMLQAQEFERKKLLTEVQENVQQSLKKELPLFQISKKARKDKALGLEVSQEQISWIWENGPQEFVVSGPLPEGGKETMHMVRSDIFTEDYGVQTSDGRLFKGKEIQGLHYQRKASGKTLIGGLSFRQDGLFGMFATDRGNYNIGEFSPGKGDYVISNEKDLGTPNWECMADQFDLDPKKPGPQPEMNKAVTPICKTVRVYFESDQEIYTRSGNNLSTASTFVNGLFNVVAQIYNNEGITVKISTIFQWTTADPYKAVTSSGTILYNFATNRPPASLNGDLAHLISARSTNLGGVGYIGVFCNTSVRHAFSSIYYQYSALPSYSWSVYVVAHEMGHNFGSRHTHWCGWSLPNGTTGRIDSCYAGEGTCGSTTKARKGTLMSYCHITSGGIDLNSGFGTLPRKAIRDGLNAATCIGASGCLSTATVRVDSATNKNNSFSLTLTAPANHGAASWQLLEGTTIAQSGTFANQNAWTQGITISGKSNGSYTYTVKLVSGTNSTTSSALTVTVSVPAPIVIIGNCGATGLQAYKNASGQWCFRFGLSTTCTNYTVQMCRYNLSDPNVIPQAGAIPVACGVRNNMNGYAPTTAERLAGTIDRVASPQPSGATTSGFGSFWYSVDVTCNGTGCTTANRTRTYFFVPGF